MNIDLPFNNSNSGTVVSGSDGWTDVVTLSFDINNPNDTLKLDWLMTNLYWGIYDANNATMWDPGTSQNLSYVINNDVTPPQLVSAAFSNSTPLILNFSEQLSSSNAQNINNYSNSNGISVSSAALSVTQVTLITSAYVAGTSVTVNNVTDLAGNFRDSNHNTATNYVLPVELNSFIGEEKNNQVTLNWVTETEVNNYGFEVERSSSSIILLQSWKKIAFVNGNGNSNSSKEYTYTDKNSTGGSKYQYRLKQIDNDGQFEYSKIVEVEMAPNEYALYQNSPNSFNPSKKISW